MNSIHRDFKPSADILDPTKGITETMVINGEVVKIKTRIEYEFGANDGHYATIVFAPLTSVRISHADNEKQRSALCHAVVVQLVDPAVYGNRDSVGAEIALDRKILYQISALAEMVNPNNASSS
jgi:hypothetical protein